MRVSEIKPGMTVLVTERIAHPSHPAPWDGAKATVVETDVGHTFYATAGFSGRGGGYRKIQTGVVVRIDGQEETETVRPGQVWSWEEWGAAWAVKQVEYKARELARQRTNERVGAAAEYLGVDLGRVYRGPADEEEVTIKLTALEALIDFKRGFDA